MTAKEAIARIRRRHCIHNEHCTCDCKRCNEYCEYGFALEALEKQIPKKPRETRCALMCARCGHKITEKGCKKLNRLYCKKCGQAIDWPQAGDTNG